MFIKVIVLLILEIFSFQLESDCNLKIIISVDRIYIKLFKLCILIELNQIQLNYQSK